MDEGALRYFRWYIAICLRAQARKITGGVERHHIIPRSCGGSDHPLNIAVLTYREHFLAHWLLTKFLVGVHRRNMQRALVKMCYAPGWSKKIVSGWQFAVAKRANIAANTGRKQTAATKAKISASQTGKKASEETRARQSLAAKNRTPETRETQRIAAKKGPSAEAKAAHAAAMQRSETRERMSAAGRSRAPISEATRAKLAAAIHRRGPISEETREKLRAAGRMPHSDATRSKLREAWKRRRSRSLVSDQPTA